MEGGTAEMQSIVFISSEKSDRFEDSLVLNQGL